MLFFVKQKTAYDMRISDWSSDVCSSDLTRRHQALPSIRVGPARPHQPNETGPRSTRALDKQIAQQRHFELGVVRQHAYHRVDSCAPRLALGATLAMWPFADDLVCVGESIECRDRLPGGARSEEQRGGK